MTQRVAYGLFLRHFIGRVESVFCYQVLAVLLVLQRVDSSQVTELHFRLVNAKHHVVHFVLRVCTATFEFLYLGRTGKFN